MAHHFLLEPWQHLREKENIPPKHPEGNPVENFMRPIGKTMKIAHQNKASLKEALQTILDNYRETPHPATNIPPSAMLFRDGWKTIFPRRSVSDKQVEEGRNHDRKQKEHHQRKVNSVKYRTPSYFKVGVLMRNYDKTVKFDPTFSLQV